MIGIFMMPPSSLITYNSSLSSAFIHVNRNIVNPLYISTG
jgi:hypothetical protein